MASHANISSRGTIENLLNLGFTLYDYLNELNDNALDAGARTVLIQIDTSTRTLTVSDDGKGMDKAGLTSALCINNTKPASEAIGLRGLGLKAGLVGLSGGLTSTLILSKKAGCEPCEVEADWPKAMREDLWNPSPAWLSRHYGSIWDKNKLNDEHGTVIWIRLPEETIQGLKKQDLLTDLGRTYETHLRRGVVMQVAIDGMVQAPLMTRAMGYEEAEFKTETPLRLLRDPTANETRVYFIHHSLRPIWSDWVRIDPADEKKKIRDYQTAIESGFVCEGEFTLRSAYNPDWNPPADADGRRAPCDGYIVPCRDGRYLRTIKGEAPHSYHHQKRRVYDSLRTALDFTHANDNEIGVQVNKSAVTRERINPLLLVTLNRIIMDWVAKLYKDLREIPEVDPAAEFEARIKRAKRQLTSLARARRERFLEEFEQWMHSWDEEDDEEESDE